MARAWIDGRLHALVLMMLLAADGCGGPAPREEAREYFRHLGKRVLTFAGYSGAGYEDPARMLEVARGVLAGFDPRTTVVNLGATAEGIGAVYELARSLGFETTGIVSSQARVHKVPISPFVDRVFFIDDEMWGGIVPGTDRLSPTSQAMVDVSDVLVGIGGGAVSRDELLAARRLGKDVRFFPADMNHRAATERAAKRGLPQPADFQGEAHAALGNAAGGAPAAR